ncbi:MAG: CdaR family protein [Eubacteriaceae bacterium]
METKKKIPLRDKLIRLFMAFAIALVLWFIVNGSSDVMLTQEFTSIPITLTNVENLASKNLVLSENKNYYLNLRIKGTDKNLRKINTKEVSAEVNLGEIDVKGTYDLEIAVKGLSNSVIIDGMNPSTLSITVDSIIREDLEVVINCEGKPANGLTVISSKSLDKVEVQGPEESIGRIHKITGNANVNGMEEDSFQYVEVMAYDVTGNQIKEIDFYPSLVESEIILGKTKSIKVIPVITGSPVDGFSVTETTAEPQKILIGGKEGVLGEITEINLEPIDVNRLEKTFTRDVKPTVPEGVYLMDPNVKVRVTVMIEPLIEKTVAIDTIKGINLSPGEYISTMKETKVLVKLEGASSVLNQLDTKGVEAFVDCTDLPPGNYELPIQTNLPNHLIKSIAPEKTTLTITQ